ncbi:MAG: hypothetical protein CMP06_00660 [Xanthomonadales bacterium]|nr:hypothetical protein [Xanthomonadales bacterium]
MKRIWLSAISIGAVLSPAISGADSSLGAGVWANYRYVLDDNRDDETFGDVADEALIIYADGAADETDEGWSYSAELRIGPGSFTDAANNSTGDTFALHKAWVGFALTPAHQLIVGKSQVPFAWKTVNFWPGDGLQAGYGDQMDVGVKLVSATPIGYQLAYFHADDWGETSTDTVDDNGHWGSSTTYRKVQTVVGNVDWPLTEHHTLSLSVQAGRLQALVPMMEQAVDGRHHALALHYHGKLDAFYVKAEFIDTQRELPDTYLASEPALPREIANQRAGFELGYERGPWFWYLDAHAALPDTAGSTTDTVYSYSPGVSYDYGPGWIYVEYLGQTGFVDRNGQVGEGDFDAVYLSMDFYL